MVVTLTVASCIFSDLVSNVVLLGFSPTPPSASSSSPSPNQSIQGSSSGSTKNTPTSNETVSGPQTSGGVTSTQLAEEFTVQMPASEGGATYNMLRLPDGTICEKDYNCTEVIASIEDQQ
jgi:hypothetical protein